MKVFALVLLFLLALQPEEKTVTDFSLKNVDGKTVSLKSFSDAKGFIVVFTCNHCPFAKLYTERLNALNKKYAALHVPLIAIASPNVFLHAEDGYPQMVETAKQKKFNFPYLFDETQDVARNFAANRTPHAFVIWKDANQWKIKYNGAIDDNGAHPQDVTKRYVEDAVNALLAGKDVAEKQTHSIGCEIQFAKK